MKRAAPKFRPEQMTLLLDMARRKEAAANLQVILGKEGAERERAEWQGIIEALEEADKPKPPQRGRPARVSDKTLLETFRRVGTVRGTTRALNYYSHSCIQRRLRRLQIGPGKPGRIPKSQTHLQQEAG